jgi:hypothetical protein
MMNVMCLLMVNFMMNFYGPFVFNLSRPSQSGGLNATAVSSIWIHASTTNKPLV